MEVNRKQYRILNFILAVLMLISAFTPLADVDIAIANEGGSGIGGYAKPGSSVDSNANYWTSESAHDAYRLTLYHAPSRADLNDGKGTKLGSSVAYPAPGRSLNTNSISSGKSVYEYQSGSWDWATYEIKGNLDYKAPADGPAKARPLFQNGFKDKVGASDYIKSKILAFENASAWSDEYIVSIFGEEVEYRGLKELAKDAGYNEELKMSGIYKVYIEPLVTFRGGDISTYENLQTQQMFSPWQGTGRLVMSTRDFIYWQSSLYTAYNDLNMATVFALFSSGVSKASNALYLTKEQIEIGMTANTGGFVRYNSNTADADRRTIKGKMQKDGQIFNSMGVGIYEVELSEEETPKQFDIIFEDKEPVKIPDIEENNPCEEGWDSENQTWTVCQPDEEKSYKMVDWCVLKEVPGDIVDPQPTKRYTTYTKIKAENLAIGEEPSEQDYIDAEIECESYGTDEETPIDPDQDIVVRWEEDENPKQVDGIYTLEEELEEEIINKCEGGWNADEKKWEICDVETETVLEFVDFCVLDKTKYEADSQFPKTLEEGFEEGLCKEYSEEREPSKDVDPEEDILVRWKEVSEEEPKQVDGIYDPDGNKETEVVNPCREGWDSDAGKWSICDPTTEDEVEMVDWCVLDGKRYEKDVQFPATKDAPLPEGLCTETGTDREPPKNIDPEDDIIVRWEKPQDEEEPLDPEDNERNYRFTVPEWRLNRYVKDMDRENEVGSQQQLYQCADIRLRGTLKPVDRANFKDYDREYFIPKPMSDDYNTWELPQNNCEELHLIYQTLNAKQHPSLPFNGYGKLQPLNLTNIQQLMVNTRFNDADSWFSSRTQSSDITGKVYRAGSSNLLPRLEPINTYIFGGNARPWAYSHAVKSQNSQAEYNRIIQSDTQHPFYSINQAKKLLGIQCLGCNDTTTANPEIRKGTMMNQGVEPNCLPIVGDAHLQKSTANYGYRLACWTSATNGQYNGIDAQLINKPNYLPYNLEVTQGFVQSTQAQSQEKQLNDLAYQVKLPDSLKYVHVYGARPVYELSREPIRLSNVVYVDNAGNYFEGTKEDGTPARIHETLDVGVFAYKDPNNNNQEVIVSRMLQTEPDRIENPPIDLGGGVVIPGGTTNITLVNVYDLADYQGMKVITKHIAEDRIQGNKEIVEGQPAFNLAGKPAVGKFEIIENGESKLAQEGARPTTTNDNLGTVKIDVINPLKSVTGLLNRYVAKDDGAVFDYNAIGVANKLRYSNSQPNVSITLSSQDTGNTRLRVIPEIAMLFDKVPPTTVNGQAVSGTNDAGSIKIVSGDKIRQISPVSFHSVEVDAKMTGARIGAAPANDSRLRPVWNQNTKPVVYKGAPLNIAYNLESKSGNSALGAGKENQPSLKAKSFIMDANATMYDCFAPIDIQTVKENVIGVHENFIKNFGTVNGNTLTMTGEGSSKIMLQGTNGTQSGANFANPDYVGPEKIVPNLQFTANTQNRIIRKFRLTVRGGILTEAVQVDQVVGNGTARAHETLKNNTPNGGYLASQLQSHIGGQSFTPYTAMGLPTEAGNKQNSVFNNFERQQGAPVSEDVFVELAAEVRRHRDDLQQGQGWYNEDTTILVVYQIIDAFEFPAGMRAFTDKVPNSVSSQEKPNYLQAPIDKSKLFSEVGKGKPVLGLKLIAKNEGVNTYTGQYSGATNIKVPMEITETRPNEFYFGVPNATIQDTFNR